MIIALAILVGLVGLGIGFRMIAARMGTSGQNQTGNNPAQPQQQAAGRSWNFPLWIVAVLLCIGLGTAIIMKATWIATLGGMDFPVFIIQLIGGCLVAIGVITALTRFGVDSSTITTCAIVALICFIFFNFGNKVDQATAEAEKAKSGDSIELDLVHGMWTKIDNMEVGERSYDFTVGAVTYYITNGEEEPPMVNELANAMRNPALAPKIVPFSKRDVNRHSLTPALYYYVTPSDAGRNGKFYIKLKK
jgi:hypothetical protein